MATNLACDLFHRCLDERGDEPWYQFHKRYGRYLKRVVRRTVRRHRLHLPEHEVEEILQELFCRVLAAPHPSFLGRSDLQLWAYLSQVVFNLLVDRYRRTVLRKRRCALIRSGAGSEWLADEMGKDTFPTPEDLALRHDSWRQLIALAARVVRPDRRSLELRALRMALLEGYSSREISHLSGGRLTPRRVDRLVYRLRKKLSATGLGLPPRRFTSRSHVRELSSMVEWHG